MNCFVKGLAAACVVGVSAVASVSTAQATTLTFSDEGPINVSHDDPFSYIGGVATGSSWQDKDVIGNNSLYNTTGAEVERVGNNLRVRVLTNYADNVGSHDTSLGALFIGDDDPAILSMLEGTLPAGSDTTQDTFETPGTNGIPGTPVAGLPYESRFQYALDFSSGLPVYDNDNRSDSNTEENGGATLYKLKGDGSDVETSSAGGIYRDGQAIRPTSDAVAVGTGSWTLDGGDKYVEFVINDFFGANSQIDSDTQNGFVFAWAMSCANDVIFEWVQPGLLETNPVPLPAGFILLLSGLLGVGWLGRSRAKQA